LPLYKQEMASNSDFLLENLFKSQISFLEESSFPQSFWVSEAKQNLLHLLDFQALVNDFSKLRQNLYIASNNATVARDKFSSICFQIQNLSSEMAKQCRNSVSLMTEFEITCKEAIVDLQLIFISLKDNQDQLAATKFKKLSGSISSMEEQSLALSKGFDSLSEKFKKCLRMLLFFKRFII